MVPRQIRETFRPVPPKLTYCIGLLGGSGLEPMAAQRRPNPAVVVDSASGFGAERLSRTGRSSTGLEVLHSSHQCLWELGSRFRIPQLSQTKTSFFSAQKKI